MNVCDTSMLFVYFSILILELFAFVSYICPTCVEFINMLFISSCQRQPSPETYLTIFLTDFGTSDQRSKAKIVFTTHWTHISDSLGYLGATLLNVAQYFVRIINKTELTPHVVLSL